MKTDRQIIDELGEWLCRDMEKDLAKQEEMDGYRRGCVSTYHASAVANMHDIAGRIRWYAENCT